MSSMQKAMLLLALFVLVLIGVKWIFLWRRIQRMGRTAPPPGLSPEPQPPTNGATQSKSQ